MGYEAKEEIAMNKKKVFGLVLVVLLMLLAGFCFMMMRHGAKGETITQEDVENSMRTDFLSLVGSIRRSPEGMGMEEADLSVLHLLGPVYLVYSDEKAQLEASSLPRSVLSFPLVDARGQIIGVYSVLKSDGEVNANLGGDYASFLEKARAAMLGQGVPEKVKDAQDQDTEVTKIEEEAKTQEDESQKAAPGERDHFVLYKDETGPYLLNIGKKEKTSLHGEVSALTEAQSALLDKIDSSYYLDLDPTSPHNKYYWEWSERLLQGEGQ